MLNETRLVFRNEYRFDLKRVESVLIPYLFENEKLIISLQANPSRNYKSGGRIEQLLIDYPNQLIGSSQVLRFGSQLLEFPRGRFKLKFYPNYYLGRFTILIKEFVEALEINQPTIPELKVLSSNVITLSPSETVNDYRISVDRVAVSVSVRNQALILSLSNIFNVSGALRTNNLAPYCTPIGYKGPVSFRNASATNSAIVDVIEYGLA